MIDESSFPHLTPLNHRVTSPASPDYNCVAWVVDDSDHWWQPGEYWPIQVPLTAASVSDLITAFEPLGFVRCADDALETDFIKVAVFASGIYFTHVARQLPNAKWTSKLGHEEDIEHDSPDDLTDGVYGQVVCYMRRPKGNP